ncbi:hypothetical protein HDU96_007001 [Phlyctochytrium bullatum]|nr:hypothetical protein HDU96_007001 [Phlyctochytrium bullatum]
MSVIIRKGEFVKVSALESDMLQPLNAFDALPQGSDKSFRSFKEAWDRSGLVLVHTICTDAEYRMLFMNTLYGLAIGWFLDRFDAVTRAASIFMLYMLYTTQPNETIASIRITPTSFSKLLDFVEVCAGNPTMRDVYVVYQKLWTSHAFLFVATETTKAARGKSVE